VKTGTITFILFILVTCAYADLPDPASEAKALFEQGKYSEGFGLLTRARRDRDAGPLQRANALKALAEFYEQLMGNPDGAERYYKMILKTKLSDDHPLKALAREELDRFSSLEKKYQKQNQSLKASRIASSRQEDKDEIKQSIAQLKALIRDNPEYYKLTEAYFYLGQNYMHLEEFRKARKLFEKCMYLKPSIKFYLPVRVWADTAHTRWIVSTISKTVWAILAVLTISAAIVFYTSRPWQWTRLRHIIPCLAVLFLWWVTFNISFIWFAETFEVTDELIKDIGAELPSFINAAPGSPGSQVTKYLFVYGIVGILGTFVFSIGISRLKSKWAALLFNSLFGLLLFASLTTVFYLRYCNDQSRFKSQAKNKLYYPKGLLCFVVEEPEPYILTNPKAYPNLQASNATDPYFQEWILKHCPSDVKP
jgi:tetratricopeptide (TPR) repeat protein